MAEIMKMQSKHVVFIIFSIVALSIPLIQILSKESVLSNGQLMYLQLDGVNDGPNFLHASLRLSYHLAASLHDPQIPHDGKIIVLLNESRVANFKSMYLNDTPLQENEFVLSYGYENGRYIFSAGSVPVPSMHAQRFKNARYAEVRVAENGQAILVSLRDERFQVL